VFVPQLLTKVIHPVHPLAQTHRPHTGRSSLPSRSLLVLWVFLAPTQLARRRDRGRALRHVVVGYMLLACSGWERNEPSEAGGEESFLSWGADWISPRAASSVPHPS
jgi:hypothetical protein